MDLMNHPTDLITFLGNRAVCCDGVRKRFSVVSFSAFICAADIVYRFASKVFSPEFELDDNFSIFNIYEKSA